MFTTPTIPTDSLYKFLLVGGIVLMLASPYFYFKNQANFSNKLDKTDSTMTYIYYNQSRLTKELNSFNRKYTSIKLNNNYTQKNIDSLKEQLEELVNFQDSLHNKFEMVKVNRDYEQSIYGIIDSCLMLMLTIGIIMCGYGFYNWLVKVQNLQDKLLELEVNARVKELNYNSRNIRRLHFEPKILPRKRN